MDAKFTEEKKTEKTMQQPYIPPKWYTETIDELKMLAKSVDGSSRLSKEEWAKIEGMLYGVGCIP